MLFSFSQFANANGEEFEVWTQVGAETEWKRLEFSLANANFFGAEKGWFLNFTQFGFDFAGKKGIRYGLAYKQEYVKFPTYTRIEYRPMLNLSFEKQLGDFSLSDRNRQEIRVIEGRVVPRYRNRLEIEYSKLNWISPYVSTESFFHANHLRYSRQRSIVGIEIPYRTLALDLFGVHQYDRGESSVKGGHINRFIFGTSLNYSF